MSKDEYLITDAPLKALTVFAMPMILGSFFQQVYNMADSIIVGQFVGSSALAAVGACAALTNVKNQFETVRFNELKRYLKTISDKTLSTNLKELEADKLIVRTEYPQIPPKVEYALSERGKSLMTVLDQLCVWGEENRLTE